MYLLMFQVKGVARLYHQLEVDVAFSNPIQETLQNCSFHVSGSGLLINPVEARCVCVCVCVKDNHTIICCPYEMSL